METIKSYTDLEQSKKLADILPLESADMCCFQNPNGGINYYGFPFLQGNKASNPIPCWSLASLLGILPEIDGSPLNIERVKAEDGYDGYYYHIEYKDKILIPYSKNPIDACVAMIERLHELNLL